MTFHSIYNWLFIPFIIDFSSFCFLEINDYLDQLKILNLLILLLSEAHRNSLEEFISLVKDIVANEDKNKMTIHNIATVIAPNLFPNLKCFKKKTSKAQEQREMLLMLDRAQHSIIVTKMFICNLQVLFQVKSNSDILIILIFYSFRCHHILLTKSNMKRVTQNFIKLNCY